MKTLNEIRDELADSLAMDFYPMCSQANDRTNVRYIVKSSCDKIVKAHAELVKGLVEALEYYAEKDNWSTYDCGGNRPHIIDEPDDELSDYVVQLGAKTFGGRRARLALANYRKLKGEM